LGRGKAIFSPLTYSIQIPSAVEAAQALRQYIDQTSSGQAEITLLAHSLGCRVALELLDSYAILPGAAAPQFPVAILMAAAIPTYFFEDLVRLWRGALLPQETVVLFSASDPVLTGAFRAGQTLAREGVFPKAVGATGRPLLGFWTHVVPTRNHHSAYFDDPTTATQIAQSFGQAAPKSLMTLDMPSEKLEPPKILTELRLDARSLVGEQLGW